MADGTTSSSGQNRDLLRIYCAICVGYHPTEVMRGLPCGHVFCDSGLQGYFKTLSANAGNQLLTLRHRKCPGCRADLKRSDEPRQLFLQACFARQSAAEADTVYDETEISTDTPTGGTMAAGTYSTQVHKRAAQAAQSVAALDRQSGSPSVRRAAQQLTSVLGSMHSDEAEDHVKALLGALASFLGDVVCGVFDALREKERLVHEGERRRARLQQQVDERTSEAEKIERLLEDALVTAERGTLEVTQLKSEVQRLETSKQADKKRIAGLQMEAEQARSTERRLRHKIVDLEAELQRTAAELETQRESAEQQRQENEDLQSQLESQIDYAYDAYDAQSEFDTVFVQGPSRSQTWETETFVGDVDLDSSPSRPTTPRRSSRAPSVVPSVAPPVTSSRGATASHARRPASGVASLLRPTFGSDWSLPPPSAKRKRTADDERKKPFPIKTDKNGRPVGQLQVGPRIKLNKYN